jgi:hypothetical protein
MNAMGVAMAADSAVTIGSDARKIFTSTDKLFQLTRTEPVGVMIHGNASLMGVPWETLIKRYREFIDHRKLPAVSAYATSFLTFLRRNSAMFPRDVQDENTRLLIARLFAIFRDHHLGPKLNKRLKGKPRGARLTVGDVEDVAERALSEYARSFREEFPRLKQFRGKARAQIARRYRAMAARELKGAFGTVPLKQSTKRALIRFALDMLSRAAFGAMHTGLVFAGFGSSEYLPHVVDYDLEGFVCGKLRIGSPDLIQIEQLGNQSSIIPFAQREVVETFMEGADRSLRERFSEQAQAALHQVGSALVSAIKGRDSKIAKEMELVLQSGVPRVIEELNRKWNEFSSAHWRPITEIVSTLPKDELAAMAEALVNLTKFKRRITPQRETVGGPIDVAVITRGDGFVWIKRKHYFDPALNPRVLARLTH